MALTIFVTFQMKGKALLLYEEVLLAATFPWGIQILSSFVFEIDNSYVCLIANCFLFKCFS